MLNLLRKEKIVNSMDSLLGENAGIAYEHPQLPPDFGRLSVAPSSVTSTLLDNYKRCICVKTLQFGRQLELTMTSRLLNRPIIVFYNNSNPTIIWHDYYLHQCPYRNNSQLKYVLQRLLYWVTFLKVVTVEVYIIYMLYMNLILLKEKGFLKTK